MTHKALPSLPLNALLTSSSVGVCEGRGRKRREGKGSELVEGWVELGKREKAREPTILVEQVKQEKQGMWSGRSWCVGAVVVGLEEEEEEREEVMMVEGETRGEESSSWRSLSFLFLLMGRLVRWRERDRTEFACERRESEM